MSRLDELTPGQAQYVLGRVVSDKKIRSREIDKYLGEMDQEIRSLEERLSMLKDAQSGASAEPAAAAKPSRKRRSRKGRKASESSADPGDSKGGRKRKKGSRKATTPEAQRSRQLQGKYISLIKRFSGRERDKYKKLASDKGREEAVKQMQAAISK